MHPHEQAMKVLHEQNLSFLADNDFLSKSEVVL